MTATTAELRTLGQIRADVRLDARGMYAHQARNRAFAASLDASMHLILDNVAAHIDATVAADEWDAIATDLERRAGA